MPSRSNDPVAAALTDAAEQVLRAVSDRAVSARAMIDGAATNLVVVIDGRSGAGKTSLARQVADQWPSGRVQLVSLDSLYPGWDGMDEGVERARAHILQPYARGEAGLWHRWDWQREQDAEPHPVDPALGLIVEGCGILTPTIAPLADVRVWVDAPDASRRTRALGRDGDTFRPHWERWAAQEDRHIERDAPQDLATILVHIP